MNNKNNNNFMFSNNFNNSITKTNESNINAKYDSNYNYNKIEKPNNFQNIPNVVFKSNSTLKNVCDNEISQPIFTDWINIYNKNNTDKFIDNGFYLSNSNQYYKKKLENINIDINKDDTWSSSTKNNNNFNIDKKSNKSDNSNTINLELDSNDNKDIDNNNNNFEVINNVDNQSNITNNINNNNNYLQFEIYNSQKFDIKNNQNYLNKKRPNIVNDNNIVTIKEKFQKTLKLDNNTRPNKVVKYTNCENNDKNSKNDNLNNEISKIQQNIITNKINNIFDNNNNYSVYTKNMYLYLNDNLNYIDKHILSKFTSKLFKSNVRKKIVDTIMKHGLIFDNKISDFMFTKLEENSNKNYQNVPTLTAIELEINDKLNKNIYNFDFSDNSDICKYLTKYKFRFTYTTFKVALNTLKLFNINNIHYYAKLDIVENNLVILEEYFTFFMDYLLLDINSNSNFSIIYLDNDDDNNNNNNKIECLTKVKKYLTINDNKNSNMNLVKELKINILFYNSIFKMLQLVNLKNYECNELNILYYNKNTLKDIQNINIKYFTDVNCYLLILLLKDNYSISTDDKKVNKFNKKLKKNRLFKNKIFLKEIIFFFISIYKSILLQGLDNFYSNIINENYSNIYFNTSLKIGVFENIKSNKDKLYISNSLILKKFNNDCRNSQNNNLYYTYEFNKKKYMFRHYLKNNTTIFKKYYINFMLNGGRINNSDLCKKKLYIFKQIQLYIELYKQMLITKN